MTWLAETQQSYDTVAANYAEHVRGSLDGSSMLRALVVMFADLARTDDGPMLDIGCGTGNTAGKLHALGHNVIGIDLSPAMVAIARSDHPGPHYDVGSMTELPYSDNSAAGAVLFWSLIHVPDADIGAALTEAFRVLKPGGIVAVGFHVGNRVNHKTDGYGGLPMNLDVHLRPVEVVADRLRTAGFQIEATMVLDPDRATPDGFVVARSQA